MLEEYTMKGSWVTPNTCAHPGTAFFALHSSHIHRQSVAGEDLRWCSSSCEAEPSCHDPCQERSFCGAGPPHRDPCRGCTSAAGPPGLARLKPTGAACMLPRDFCSASCVSDARKTAHVAFSWNDPAQAVITLLCVSWLMTDSTPG